MIRSRFVALATALAVAASLAVATAPADRAEAATGADFNPGYIISDSAMYNGNAMGTGEVQAFLNSKVPVCRSSYACLTNYGQDTPTIPASAFCSTYQGLPSESAAQIIARVGIACSISQKVLLVLLEKEQSLVSSSTPTATRFAKATGFGCPDTAPCDSSYGGFFYQVYYAARQFQLYAARPGSYNYQAGRVNNVLFNPNAACGSSPVFIQNKATAGLYNYTPYQPNAAALANMYGLGDGCSAYGNRNFWRMYSDFFGSPIQASSLLRTTANPTLYLVSGSSKYPIASQSVYAALSPLGPVGYVSQTYLDGFSTGHVMGRGIRGPDGTIYFYDSGIKLPFTSCAQASDYGSSCDTSGYVQMTQSQLNAFYTGPVLSSVLGTPSGGRYWITAGTKREILDDQSQTDAGIPLGYNMLSDGAVADLPLGAPVVRDSAFTMSRSTGVVSLLAGSRRYDASAATSSGLNLPASLAGSLSAASLTQIPAASVPFTGIVRGGSGTSVSVLTSTGRLELAPGTGGSTAFEPAPVSQRFLDVFPSKGTLAAGSLVKAPDGATVYVVMPTNIRPIGSWAALLALTAPGAQPTISTLSPEVLSRFPQGNVALTTGALVRSPEDATVYLINGVTNRVPFASFDVPNEAGFTTFSYAPQAQLSAYPTAPAILGYGLTCASKNYVAAGGSLHEVTAANAGLYPMTFTQLDSFTCQNAAIGSLATHFIRVPNGTIFFLQDGRKKPITSMARLSELGGAEGWLNVSDGFAAALVTGPAA